MKHFITCNLCGKLVVVKSEYMTFCPACNRKMDNSYAAWKKLNPERDFRSYQQEMCVSDAALKGADEQKKIGKRIGRKRETKRIFTIFSLALVGVFLVSGVWWYLSHHRSSSSMKGLLEGAWKIALYDDLGATIKFPYTLELEASFTADSLLSEPLAETDTLQPQVVLGAVSRSWSQKETVRVHASRIDYEPDFGVDRDMATGQILMSMLQDNELRGFDFFRNDYSVTNMDARSMSGSYVLGVEAYEFRALMIQRRHTVWYFMVSYPRSQPEGILVAERFFDGILLDRE